MYNQSITELNSTLSWPWANYSWNRGLKILFILTLQVKPDYSSHAFRPFVFPGRFSWNRGLQILFTLIIWFMGILNLLHNNIWNDSSSCHGQGSSMLMESEHNTITRKELEEDKNKNTRKWYYPETRSTRMPKSGVEPEWFNNTRCLPYIAETVPCMIESGLHAWLPRGYHAWRPRSRSSVHVITTRSNIKVLAWQCEHT